MESVIQPVQESPRLDLLDRQEFVNRMLTIAEALSDNKKNACYAVNGDWGVGKTFVLDMFEEQAKELGVEGEELPRFLIFRYNCWEYDYYEEPLVAIVASVLDQIDEKVDLLPADLKSRIVAVLKAVGKGLLKKAVQVVEQKTGIDLQEAADIIKDGSKEAEKAAKESHEYDQYFNFKKNLKILQETIASLSKEQTVIFIVDELDRCLPEYTIKVLERLHHLFNEVANVQVILSIDVGQLEHVVHQIYGEGTDAKKYLRKFIQFEMKLDEGVIKDNFHERFHQYTQHFEVQSKTTSQTEVDEFKTYILLGLDMRTRISIIDRCNLIHELVCDEEKADLSYMCMEMLLVILNDYGIDIPFAKRSFNIKTLFEKNHLRQNNEDDVPTGLKHLSNLYKHNHDSGEEMYKIFNRVSATTYNGTIFIAYVDASCLLGNLVGAYRSVLGIEDDQYQFPRGNYDQKSLNDYAKQFWEILQIIR